MPARASKNRAVRCRTDLLKQAQKFLHQLECPPGMHFPSFYVLQVKEFDNLPRTQAFHACEFLPENLGCPLYILFLRAVFPDYRKFVQSVWKIAETITNVVGILRFVAPPRAWAFSPSTPVSTSVNIIKLRLRACRYYWDRFQLEATRSSLIGTNANQQWLRDVKIPEGGGSSHGAWRKRSALHAIHGPQSSTVTV